MNKTYSQSIRSVAWAYLLIHFHINLATIDILPDWWGYMLIFSALPAIAEKEPTAKLLEKFVMLMIGYTAIEWLLKIFGVTLDVYILSIFVSVIYIYTHFQLLTNIADIADREASAGHGAAIRRLRTWVVVGITATNIIMSFLPNLWLVYGIALANILIFVILSAQLFSYAKEEAAMENL